MYYYLAIVKEKDLLKGNITPSYILCKTNGKSENRSPWHVVQAQHDNGNLPKLLVTSLVGNDFIIEFMSNYRTRDKHYYIKGRHTKAMRKYYPKGALFWFPCDINGIQKGPALFVKRVPDKTCAQTDQGLQIYKRFVDYKPTLKEVLSRDASVLDLVQSNVKPKLFQSKRGGR